jgi:hypothetical protein
MQFSSFHYTRWASRTPALHGHKKSHRPYLLIYKMWASWTSTVHGHKNFAMSHFLIYTRWASRTPTVHGGRKSNFHHLITQGGLPGLPPCVGIKIQISPSHYARWASRTPTVHWVKNAIFTFSLQKVGFQDSHCVGVHKKSHRSYLLTYRNGLPGLPL